MTSKKLGLGIQIDLATSGFSSLAKGIQELKQAGIEVDDLEKSVSQLGKAYKDVDESQKLIKSFKKLKKESKAVTEAINKQEQELKQLSREVSNSPTKKMVADFEKAKKTAKQLKQRQQGLSSALQKTRTELKQNGISTKKLAEAQARLNTKSKYLQSTTANLGNKLRIARKEIDKTSKSQKQLELNTDKTTAKLGGLGLKAGVVAIALGALTLTAKGIVAELTNVDEKFDRMERSFTQITGSTESAVVEMDRMIDVANRLGVSFSEVSQGYTGFLASAKGANITFSESSAIFERTAAKVLAMGGSTAEVNGVLLAFSQILSKGVVATEELNQIAERLPGTFKFAADAMSVSTGELRDLIATGKVASADFLPKFVAQLESTEKAQEANIQTAAKLRNEWELLVNSLDKSIGVSDGVQGAMGDLAEIIKLMRHEADGDIDLIPDGLGDNLLSAIPIVNAYVGLIKKVKDNAIDYVKEQNKIADANVRARRSTEALAAATDLLNKARTAGDLGKVTQAEKEVTAALEEQTNALFAIDRANDTAEKKQAEKALKAVEAIRAEKLANEEMLAVYSSLVKSKKRLEEAGQTESEHYRYVSENIDKLAGAVDAYNKKILESKAVLESYSVGTVDEMQKIRDAANDVGISLNEIMTGITDKEQQTISSLQSTIDQIKKMGGSAKETGERVERYLNAAFSKLKTPEGIKAAISELESLKTKTPETVSQIESLKNKLNETNPAFKSLAESIKKATTTEQVRAFGQAARKAFEEGKISAEQLEIQLNNVAKKIREINEADISAPINNSTTSTKENTAAVKENAEAMNESADAVKANAEALDETSKAGGKAMSVLEMVRANYTELPAAVEAFDNVMGSIKGITTSASHAFELLDRAEAAATLAIEKHAEATKRAAEVSAELNDKISDNTLSMQDIESATGFATEAMGLLNEAELKDLNDSIDSARQKLQSLEDKAKETAAAVADRLADATGSAKDKTDRRFQREIENIKKQQAEAGDVGSAAYSQAIQDLEKLRQIELKKQADREKESARRKVESEKRKAESERKTAERQAQHQNQQRQHNKQQQRTGNTLVLQLGEAKIDIKQVAEETMRQLEMEIRNYHKGKGR